MLLRTSLGVFVVRHVWPVDVMTMTVLPRFLPGSERPATGRIGCWASAGRRDAAIARRNLVSHHHHGHHQYVHHQHAHRHHDHQQYLEDNPVGEPFHPRPRRSNDHWEFAALLPHSMLQVLRLQVGQKTTIFTIYYFTLHAVYVGYLVRWKYFYLVRRKYFYLVRSNCLLWCQTTFQAIVSFPRHETTLYPLFISDNGSRNKKTAMYLPPRAVKSFAPLQLGPKQYKSVI